MMNTCPFCLKEVSPNAKFCRSCGKSLVGVVRCLKCGSVLATGAKFCNKCGSPAPKVCPQCGGALVPNAKFCTKCGCSIPDSFWIGANVCLKCNSPLKPGAKFCSVCGTSCEQAKAEKSLNEEKKEPSEIVEEKVPVNNENLKEQVSANNEIVKEQVPANNDKLKEQTSEQSNEMKVEQKTEQKIEQKAETPASQPEPLKSDCPYCGKLVNVNTKFCPECGKSLLNAKKCSKCGSFLKLGASFCNKCGTTVPKLCRQCGQVLPENVKFCPNCGCSATAVAPTPVKPNPFSEVAEPLNETPRATSANTAGKLCRVREGKILAGVCSGLQAKFNLNAWIFRLLFLFSGFGLLPYIVLALVLKYDDEVQPTVAGVQQNVANEAGDTPWSRAKKDKTIAIILSVFLGALGIDRFYLGYTKKGVVKLIFPLLIILVGAIFLIVSQCTRDFDVIEVMGIVSMILAAILGIVTVVFYIADIVRLLTGKLLPKNAVVSDVGEQCVPKKVEKKETFTEITEKSKTFVMSLYRLKNDKILAGVCVGIADKYKINVWLIRAVALLTGLGTLLYIILAIVLKYKDDEVVDEQKTLQNKIASINNKGKKIAVVAGVVALIGVAVALVFVLGGKSDGVFVDSRDGQKYKTVSFARWTFMTENMRFNIGLNVCKTDDPTCEKHGRYYNQATAAVVCPPGWKIFNQKQDVEIVVMMEIAKKYGVDVLEAKEKIRALIAENGKEWMDKEVKAAIHNFFDSTACIFDIKKNDFTCGREYCSSEGVCAKEYVGCLNAGDKLQCYNDSDPFGDGESIKNKAAPIRCYKEMDESEWLALPEVQKKMKHIAEEAAKKLAEQETADQAAEEARELYRQEQERLAAEEAAREEQERQAAEEAARAEQEAADQAAEEARELYRQEQERLAAEEAAREEQERLAAEQAAREEQERQAAEEAAREEQERLAAERAAEEALRQERERQAAEEMANSQSNNALGVVKVASTKSIQVYYSGNENIFTEADVNAFLKKNKNPLLAVYRNLIESRGEFETVVRFRVTVNLENGKILDVEDISDDANMAEAGHVILFKQISVKMRNSWRLLPQKISGTAIVDFPVRFQLQ